MQKSTRRTIVVSLAAAFLTGCASQSRPIPTASIESAPAAIAALEARLDIEGNNLANTDTPGFKATRALIEEDAAKGVRLAGTRLDMSEGPLKVTDRPLDLCIQGEGFFCITDGEGLLYTRAGAFEADRDGILVLSGARRRPLVPEITIPPNAHHIDITTDGRVQAQIDGQPEPQDLGQLEIATFPAPERLQPKRLPLRRIRRLRLTRHRPTRHPLPRLPSLRHPRRLQRRPSPRHPGHCEDAPATGSLVSAGAERGRRRLRVGPLTLIPA
jgi:hypothetical protein